MYDTYAPIYARIGQPAWSVRMAAWALNWLHEHHVHVARVADFGCGTGAAARVFAGNGLHVVGVDRARTMLELAEHETNGRITWLQADIRTVELAEPVDLVTAFYDTLNYLLTVEELEQAWQRIGAALVAGGHAFVDVLTPAAYRAEWNDRDVVVADTDDVFVLNRLRFDPQAAIGTGRVRWWERQAEDWLGDEEIHRQRAHSAAEMRQAIERAGLAVVDCRSPDGGHPAPDATRLIYVAHKAG